MMIVHAYRKWVALQMWDLDLGSIVSTSCLSLCFGMTCATGAKETKVCQEPRIASPHPIQRKLKMRRATNHTQPDRYHVTVQKCHVECYCMSFSLVWALEPQPLAPSCGGPRQVVFALVAPCQQACAFRCTGNSGGCWGGGGEDRPGEGFRLRALGLRVPTFPLHVGLLNARR